MTSHDPDDARNPWSAASGDVGLGGSADPYAQPNQPYAQPPTQPYAQPPTQPYAQPPTQPYAQPPTQPFPAYQPAPEPYGYGQQSYGPVDPGRGVINPYATGPGGFYGQQNHPQAVMAMVFGIIGLIPCLSLLAIPATILGRKVVTDSRRDPGRWTGTGMGTAGFVLGIVGLAFGVIYLLGWIAGIVTG